VEECVRLGVVTFYAAPGSRSTPLVMAVSRHPDADLEMHVDERATAFMALGYGRATGRPAAWITTSGTALANGYPAIVEASLEAVPMLLLTADRPPELRDTDANQTIRQDRMFGDYVRWFVDLPTPSQEIAPTWLLSTVDHAVHQTRTGPVHVNCMFRKPLVPGPDSLSDRSAWWEAECESEELGSWARSSTPFTQHVVAEELAGVDIESIAERVRASNRPLFVFGRMRGPTDVTKRAASGLLEALPTAALVDIGSQLRTGMEHERLIPAADALLYGEPREQLLPDLIIQFGATPVSKRLTDWAPETFRIVVDDRLRRIDPASRGGLRIQAPPVRMMERMSEQLAASSIEVNPTWQAHWAAAKQAVNGWLEDDLGDDLTEQNVASTMSRHVSEGVSLTIASSNPVRHADQYFQNDGTAVSVSVNRGASGIDGTLATASGFADGSGTRPCVLIGDLALQHDLTSLAPCAERGAVVVVINNDGGGIFSYLPIRKHEEVFEPVFGTPHGQDFVHAAQHFGLDYANPTSLDELDAELQAAFKMDDPILIEVKTNRDANLEEQRRLLRALQDRLNT